MANDYLRFTAIWLLLVGATLLAWLLGHGASGHVGHLPPAITAAILVVAFAKIALVMAYFMEVRLAPGWLAALAVGWGIILCSGLIWLMAR